MEKVPPLPKKRKGHGLAVGPGVYWWRVWDDYRKEGGTMGYANFIEANRKLQKERNRKDRGNKK